MMQFSTRELNQNTSKIQKQAKLESVVITNRGKPDQVLMSYERFLQLQGTQKSDRVTLAEAIGFTDAADIDFDPPRVEIGFRPVDF